MEKIAYLIGLFIVLMACNENKERNSHYITNQSPLTVKPYTQLPLGAIKPRGMLERQLELQRDGLTGHLDSIYSSVCGERNGWLGGDGDAWERGPYWLDGLVGVAYILDDSRLKAKLQRWVEWSIANQRADGYFGPIPFDTIPTPEEGLQRGNRADWWPKMVMLKVLKQYYMATLDERVITLMTNYFKYMNKMLPSQPLDHWTYWGNRRGGDNLDIVYWLYNITKEPYLLELGELIYAQTFDWETAFTDGRLSNLNPTSNIHCVNLVMGLKTPAIYFQQDSKEEHLQSIKIGLKSLLATHGYVNGMFGGDERLHGNSPTQGIELCSIVEMMYSFEHILSITGEVYYADYLEKLAYNVLPTQINDDYTRRQYFQQTNQVNVSRDVRNFFNNEDHRNLMGVLTGYPCCTSNMHQGWPKFIQNLWYASADNGVAALVYGPSEVKMKVGSRDEVHFIERTNYPFNEEVEFEYLSEKSLAFPFHLRIPEWTNKATIKINGEIIKFGKSGKIEVLKRIWEKGDILTLSLPMEVKTSRWAESSVGIERGPLVYAMPVLSDEKENRSDDFPYSWFTYSAKEDWNFGITEDNLKDAEFVVIENKAFDKMPWNEKNSPIKMQVKLKKAKYWDMYNHSAGPMPCNIEFAITNGVSYDSEYLIDLIPYGCTMLRIAQFPVLSEHD